MKINFVYHTPQMLGSGYMGSTGLKRAFAHNNYLDYSYNTVRGLQLLDQERLKSNPILYIRGMLPGRVSLVIKGEDQFKATWQSESYYTRHGEIERSTPHMLEHQDKFNMVFVCSETDLTLYDIPTYWLPSWADITVLDDICKVEYEGLGFVGGHEGREDFLNGDTLGILNCKNTVLKEGLAGDDYAMEATRDYAALMSKFKMLVSPPGRCFNGMCGRAFEIMACNRLCFQWLNEDTMYKHIKYFTDGEDIVYFKDWSELNSKYKYYFNNPREMWRVAKNGYDKVRQFHNQDVRAKYIVTCMEKEYTNWKVEQDKIPSLYELTK